MSAPLAIRGLGCLSVLGSGIDAHRAALASPPRPFRSLAELEGGPDGFARHLAGWIEPRALLRHRKWSPSSAAALEVARQAIADAGWSPDDARDAALFS